jgi:hypothetical protein
VVVEVLTVVEVLADIAQMSLANLLAVEHLPKARFMQALELPTPLP